MIAGEFEPGTGLPLIRAHVWLVETDIRMDIAGVVDLTIPRSSLSTADLPAVRRSPADRSDVRAILTLDHEDGTRSGFFLDLHTTDADYSRLGRDVLERTVVVYDPRGGNLLVEVLDADL
ncbi:MAG: hypothetical protein ACKVT1_13535 [Dehalococcoidia bacterium]